MLKININDPELVNLDDYTPFYEYRGELFTGIIYEENEEGKIIEEQSFLKGQLHGVSRSWMGEGILMVEEFFEEGKLHGLHRSWNEEGNLLQSILFEKGEALEYKKYSEEGKLIAQKYSTGEEVFWDNEGKIQKLIAMRKETAYHQLTQTFFVSGQLKTEEINGKFSGDVQLGFHEQQKTWNEAGDLLKFSQIQFGKDKWNSAYNIRFEVHQVFHEKGMHKGKTSLEKVLTVFSTSLLGNEHTWTEERQFSFLSGEVAIYKQNYHLTLKPKGSSKNIEKEKALCLRWHKKNPYKFPFP